MLQRLVSSVICALQYVVEPVDDIPYSASMLELALARTGIDISMEGSFTTFQFRFHADVWWPSPHVRFVHFFEGQIETRGPVKKPTT